MLQVSGQVSRRAGPIRLQAEVVGRVMLDEADVEPSTELGVRSHWDWEHLALFGFFFMFFRQTGARASNCFRFKDKLCPIFLRFHSFTIYDSVEPVHSLKVSSADVSSEFSPSVHCSLPLCGNSSIEVLKFIPL